MPTDASRFRLIWLIVFGLFAWGVLLAVGTLLVPGQLPALRGLIVLVCTLAFIGFWGVMLLIRNRRMREGEKPSIKFPPPGA